MKYNPIIPPEEEGVAEMGRPYYENASFREKVKYVTVSICVMSLICYILYMAMKGMTCDC